MKTNLCLVACFALVGMAWGETPKLPGDRVATIAFFEENVYGRKPDLSSFEKRSQVVDRGRWTGTRAIRRDVTLNTLTPWGETNFTAVALIPKDVSRGRVPCFVYISFEDPDAILAQRQGIRH